MHNDLENDREFNERLGALPDGVYIFGHSHIQWSYQSGNGKRICKTTRNDKFSWRIFYIVYL